MAATGVYVLRRLTTGTTGNHYPDDPNTPPTVDTEATPGPWPATAQPWADGQEDPSAPGLTPSPNPTLPQPDVGWDALPGAYEGAYRTTGPVTAFGEERQAVGRTMRFGNNRPDRAPDLSIGEAAVMDGPSYLDEVAASLWANGQQPESDAQVNANLVTYT